MSCENRDKIRALQEAQITETYMEKSRTNNTTMVKFLRRCDGDCFFTSNIQESHPTRVKSPPFLVGFSKINHGMEIYFS